MRTCFYIVKHQNSSHIKGLNFLKFWIVHTNNTVPLVGAADSNIVSLLSMDRSAGYNTNERYKCIPEVLC